ncbi:predicted protein [Lichtheimia corymbifera JMRC:FSU:9682]|uniref:UrcA family protein n=1 Tax=Lichtheimia corymbifera JMRC:FSU:9682 TaxID=1263082 RepID=A0A068S785_9FUNG|nr:predicted protein [Lichtheimia corymbifera JMRC:FSU:9682]
MRFSSSLALLAAMFMLGVTAAGDTTSAPAANGPVLSPEVQEKVDVYVERWGERAQTIVTASKDMCKEAKGGMFDGCVIYTIYDQADDFGLPPLQL